MQLMKQALYLQATTAGSLTPTFRNMYYCFSVSNKLMKYFGKNDLGRRIGPRLDAFQSIGSDAVTTGVMYWIKTYLFRDYCEAKNGYVCQRPAAAGAASEANGKNICNGRDQ